MATLRCLARERLTGRQKRLLLYAYRLDACLPSARFIKEASRVLGCSPSTCWGCLRTLRRSMLIGSGQGRSSAIVLTPAGEAVASALEGG